MNNLTETNSITKSFSDLISDNKKIKIPIIQRDYAQGREDDKTNKVRAQFLKSLVEALEQSKGALELDFVYGYVENEVVYPLDGQQRLTTLFLLHWYLAHKTGELTEFKDKLDKFTYETRISSREFCEQLVKSGDNLGAGKTVSERIADASWFFLAWKKDPTIKAMLVMLDSIEVLLKDKKELKKYLDRLTSFDSPIKFQFMKLNHIGLTDDLYIKMNARGKPLTEFEGFKARFENHIKNKEWEQGNQLLKGFSHNIDTVWTDLFWKYRDDKNGIDNKIIKFISGIAIGCYAKTLDIHKDEEDAKRVREALIKEKRVKSVTDEAVKRERIEQRIRILINKPTEVHPLDFVTKDTFEYLKKCFNLYSKDDKDKIAPNGLTFWGLTEKKEIVIRKDFKIDNNLFTEFIKDSETDYKKRVLFYAQTEYLLGIEKVDDVSFSDWMRVIRNIVENATLDSVATFIGAIGLIKELSEGYGNIYEYLSQHEVKSNFASDQVREENLKAHFICNIEGAKSTIFSIEDTNFFKGKISFALYCINVNQVGNYFNVGLLDSIKRVVVAHLNEPSITNKFRRALLTIGNNDFYNYWGTWSYGTDTHKRCLIKDTAELKNHFTNGWRTYLRDLLLKLVDFDSNLDTLINNYVPPVNIPNWKTRLIKESDLLDNHCQAHYFGINPDGNSCFLYGYRKRPSSRGECKLVK